jgi:isoleucyl-tRNA synthetase
VTPAFGEVESQVDFPAQERCILEFWRQGDLYRKSVDARPAERTFRFFDGPPFATGLPHYGHLLASITKDVVPRYWTMRGYRVERRWGWDCHGLPVENEAEQQLGLRSRRDILEYGVPRFNEACRDLVLRYTSEWQSLIERLGRWVDWDNQYRTMDSDFMESVWWVFKSLWDQGLVYEGFKSLAYCPRCSTPLRATRTRRIRRSRCASPSSASPACHCWHGRRRPGPCPPTWVWPWVATSTTCASRPRTASS